MDTLQYRLPRVHTVPCECGIAPAVHINCCVLSWAAAVRGTDVGSRELQRATYAIRPLAAVTLTQYYAPQVFFSILYNDLDFERPPWDAISPLAKDFVKSLLQVRRAVPGCGCGCEHRVGARALCL